MTKQVINFTGIEIDGAEMCHQNVRDQLTSIVTVDKVTRGILKMAAQIVVEAAGAGNSAMLKMSEFPGPWGWAIMDHCTAKDVEVMWVDKVHNIQVMKQYCSCGAELEHGRSQTCSSMYHLHMCNKCAVAQHML